MIFLQQKTAHGRLWFSQWALPQSLLFSWATSSIMASIIRWLMSQPKGIRARSRCSILWNLSFQCGFGLKIRCLFVFLLNHHVPNQNSIKLAPLWRTVPFSDPRHMRNAQRPEVQSTPYLPDTWQADQLPPGILASSSVGTGWKMLKHQTTSSRSARKL